MKYRLLAISLLLVAGLAAGSSAVMGQADHKGAPHSQTMEGSDFTERDEIRQTYQLSPGARVEVERINGTVDIETSNGSNAEVHIIRSARNKEDLNFRKIIVDHSSGALSVRGEKEDNWDRSTHNPQVRHRVVLKLPRQIELNVGGVNGRVNIGEVDGPVEASGINGRVEIGQSVGYTNLSGINGKVSVKIVRLTDRGIHVSGINGGVDLMFTDDLNADINVTGINGTVDADFPNVVVQGKPTRSNYRARIGSGGMQITASGINGRVRLTRAGL
ncbi:MAG TPA: hypothetical protein VE262_13645 [Blastocatellia bacterium]|nr:hypothetical protein [Blastocatellia bacterium]